MNGQRETSDDSQGNGSDGREGARQGTNQEAPPGDSEGGSRRPVGRQEAGYIYFIETIDGRFVKIGYSTQPYQRLSQLGTLRPGNYALRLIGWLPGAYETERWLHSKFSADRDNGEWFRDSVMLRQFIAALGLIEPEPEVAKPEPVVKPQRPAHSPRPAHDHGILGLSIHPSRICDCHRCGFAWVKRAAGRPVLCPKCKSPYWYVAAGTLPMGRPVTKKKAKKKVAK